MNRLLLASAVLAAIGAAGGAHAQVVLDDPPNLHVGNDPTGGLGLDPNPLPNPKSFYIANVSGGSGNAVLNPPGVFVFFAVPTGPGITPTVPVITGVTEPGITTPIVVQESTPKALFDWTGQNTDILTFMQKGLVKTTAPTETFLQLLVADLPGFTSADASLFLNAKGVDNSIHFASMTGFDEMTTGGLKTPFASGAITGFELYGFDIEAPLSQTDLHFTGSFGEGTFVVPFGFGTKNFETTQWTNVGAFTDAVTSGVPEPRTWVSLALGFALLGGIGLRRKQRVAAFA
jgi:hypothetical protein